MPMTIRRRTRILPAAESSGHFPGSQIGRRLLLPLIAALALVTSVPDSGSTTPQPLGNPGTWRLVFDDEFNGTSLDLSKWQPNWLAASDGAISPPVNRHEPQCYDPAQVTVSGGYLNLDAVQRQCTDYRGGTRRYASGLIESNGGFNFTFGHAEARMWLPGDSAGTPVNWPAFWSDGQSWPRDGEDDIMEVLSRKTCFAYHYSGGVHGSVCTARKSGWHTFASDWEPGVVNYFYDGVKVGTFTSGITSSPHYLILNHALGNSLIRVPSRVQVDYVRVWQH